MILYRGDWGLFWPDWDQKAQKNHDYIQKHLPTMDFAVSQCGQRRVCVQAGGHVGIWPKRLAGLFDQVLTFEPEPDLFACLEKNLSLFTNIQPQETALSNQNRIGHMERSSSSGSNRVGSGSTEIDLMTLDALALPVCDAIFLDVEGHELQALQGAKETIQRCQPVIQVEELDDGNAVNLFLKGLGYLPVAEKQGKDRVYLPCSIL